MVVNELYRAGLDTVSVAIKTTVETGLMPVKIIVYTSATVGTTIYLYFVKTSPYETLVLTTEGIQILINYADSFLPGARTVFGWISWIEKWFNKSGITKFLSNGYATGLFGLIVVRILSSWSALKHGFSIDKETKEKKWDWEKRLVVAGVLACDLYSLVHNSFAQNLFYNFVYGKEVSPEQLAFFYENIANRAQLEYTPNPSPYIKNIAQEHYNRLSSYTFFHPSINSTEILKNIGTGLSQTGVTFTKEVSVTSISLRNLYQSTIQKEVTDWNLTSTDPVEFLQVELGDKFSNQALVSTGVISLLSFGFYFGGNTWEWVRTNYNYLLYDYKPQDIQRFNEKNLKFLANKSIDINDSKEKEMIDFFSPIGSSKSNEELWSTHIIKDFQDSEAKEILKQICIEWRLNYILYGKNSKINLYSIWMNQLEMLKSSFQIYMLPFNNSQLIRLLHLHYNCDYINENERNHLYYFLLYLTEYQFKSVTSKGESRQSFIKGDDFKFMDNLSKISKWYYQSLSDKEEIKKIEEEIKKLNLSSVDTRESIKLLKKRQTSHEDLNTGIPLFTGLVFREILVKYNAEITYSTSRRIVKQIWDDTFVDKLVDDLDESFYEAGTLKKGITEKINSILLIYKKNPENREDLLQEVWKGQELQAYTIDLSRKYTDPYLIIQEMKVIEQAWRKKWEQYHWKYIFDEKQFIDFFNRCSKVSADNKRQDTFKSDLRIWKSNKNYVSIKDPHLKHWIEFVHEKDGNYDRVQNFYKMIPLDDLKANGV